MMCVFGVGVWMGGFLILRRYEINKKYYEDSVSTTIFSRTTLLKIVKLTHLEESVFIE